MVTNKIGSLYLEYKLFEKDKSKIIKKMKQKSMRSDKKYYKNSFKKKSKELKRGIH